MSFFEKFEHLHALSKPAQMIIWLVLFSIGVTPTVLLIPFIRLQLLLLQS